MKKGKNEKSSYRQKEPNIVVLFHTNKCKQC